MKKIAKAIVSVYSWRSPTFLCVWVLTITGVLILAIPFVPLVRGRSIEMKAQAAPVIEKNIEYIQAAPETYKVPLSIWLAGGISLLGALVSFYMAIRAIRARNEAQDSCQKAAMYHDPPDLAAKVEEAKRWAEEAKKHAENAVSDAAVLEPVPSDCNYPFCYSAPFVDLPPYPGGEATTHIVFGYDSDFVAARMAVVGVNPCTGQALAPEAESYEIAIRDTSLDRTMSNVPVHIQSFVRSPNWSMPFAKGKIFRRNSTVVVTVRNLTTSPARVYVTLVGYKTYPPPTDPLRDFKLKFERDAYYNTNVIPVLDDHLDDDGADDEEDDDYETDDETDDKISDFGGQHKRYYTAEEFMRGDGSEDRNA